MAEKGLPEKGSPFYGIVPFDPKYVNREFLKKIT